MSRNDSFRYAMVLNYYYRCFDEPNLSLAARAQPVFRFVYDQWGEPPVLITLQNDSIMVKKGIYGGANIFYDEDKLSWPERREFEVLRSYFPVRDYIKKHPDTTKYRIQDIRRLLNKNPNMDDISYYKNLTLRAARTDTVKLVYEKYLVPISHSKYIHIVRGINESGYWQMPIQVACEHPDTDGAGFSLEANIAGSYKFVGYSSCEDDHSKFVKVCQELLDAAGLGKKIQLIWKAQGYTMDTADVIQNSGPASDTVFSISTDKK
jgi:hypothetical protein